MLKIFHVRVDGLFAGTEKIVYEYLKRLDRNRFENRFIALVNDGPLSKRVRDLGLGVDTVPMSSRFDSGAGEVLRSLVQEHGPDLIVSYGIRADWVTWKMAQSTGVHWISQVQNLVYNDYPNLLVGRSMYLLDRWLVRKADAVIAAARLPQRTLSQGALASKRVEYIPNGVDFDFYNPHETDKHYRQSLRISDETKMLSCIGRLEPVKGQEYLIEALPKLRDQFGKVFLVLAGTGSSEERLRKLVREQGNEDIVHFAGFVDDVKSILASTDLYVAPSLHEGMPSAVMEAMAMQVPVVATSVGGHLELLGESAPENLVPVKNSDRLAKKIAEVLSDYPVAQKRAAEGRDWLKKNQSWDTITPKLEKLLSDIAG